MTLEAAVPDTTLSNTTSLREKTVLAGRIARALAVFCVDRIIVYTTGRLPSRQQRDVDTLVRLLRYMDTPQYLRKRVFARTPTLRYAGLLPPLRTRSHPLETSPSEVRVGDVRWGIGVGPRTVDIGLASLVKVNFDVDNRTPTLFRVTRTSPRITLRPVERHSVSRYFGFEVAVVPNLVEWLKQQNRAVRVVFSRRGTDFKSVINDIVESVTGPRHLIALFGGPKLGLPDILVKGSEEFLSLVDYVVNTIPNQGTETVRLEEAMIASLALMNVSLGHLVSRPGYYDGID